MVTAAPHKRAPYSYTSSCEARAHNAQAVCVIGASGKATASSDGSCREAESTAAVDVKATMAKVAAYYVEHRTEKEAADCGWKQSAFMQGALATARTTGNSKWADLVYKWAERHEWKACNYPSVLTERGGANDMSCGQSFAELYMERQHNDTFIASIRDGVLAKLVDRSRVDDWWWVDAYFMALGTFARIGHITGDVRFHDKGLALYNDSAVRRGLWSAADGLYFRDESYMNQSTPSGVRVFWGRGNGWAAGAMARALMYTPSNHPARAIYTAQLAAMAKTLKRIQGADGMWRASMLDPEQVPNPETTSSAGITFGLAYGIHAGVLDRETYGPTVQRAWAGLTKVAVHESGLLGYCQPVGAGPAPAEASQSSDFCVGLFLLAGSEVAKLASDW